MIFQQGRPGMIFAVFWLIQLDVGVQYMHCEASIHSPGLKQNLCSLSFHSHESDVDKQRKYSLQGVGVL
mgnify:CR=1 FL=1